MVFLILGKFVLKVCFEISFTSVISAPKYKVPPPPIKIQFSCQNLHFFILKLFACENVAFLCKILYKSVKKGSLGVDCRIRGVFGCVLNIKKVSIDRQLISNGSTPSGLHHIM